METINALGRIALAIGIVVACYGLWSIGGALLWIMRKYFKRFFGMKEA